MLAAGLLACCPLLAPVLGPTFPPAPADGQYVVDEANLLDDPTLLRITSLCAQAEEAARTPIRVVTLASLASRGAHGWTVERYARALFDHWGIGSRNDNRGMLLLVAHGDRRARIELGAHWGHHQDQATQRIMDVLIVPKFKRGDFGEGIALGVSGLDAIARDAPLPSPPRSGRGTAFGVVLFLVGVAVVVSLVRWGIRGLAGRSLHTLAAPVRGAAALSTLPRHRRRRRRRRAAATESDPESRAGTPKLVPVRTADDRPDTRARARRARRARTYGDTDGCVVASDAGSTWTSSGSSSFGSSWSSGGGFSGGSSGGGFSGGGGASGSW